MKDHFYVVIWIAASGNEKETFFFDFLNAFTFGTEIASHLRFKPRIRKVFYDEVEV